MTNFDSLVNKCVALRTGQTGTITNAVPEFTGQTGKLTLTLELSNNTTRQVTVIIGTDNTGALTIVKPGNGNSYSIIKSDSYLFKVVTVLLAKGFFSTLNPRKTT